MKRGLVFLSAIFLTVFSLNISAQTKLPKWAKGVVWYQIFPERFANDDTTNDPTAAKVFINSRRIPKDWQVTKWTSDWFAESKWEKELGGSFRSHLFDRRYGGDIQGIIDHLDYLKKLGIGAIYLNPMFEAVSLHKYDGSTYHHIDVNFGPDPAGDRKIIASETPDDPSTWKWTSADKLFLKLIKEVHKRGMRIIIDGVFNHTGVQFWAFQDIIKNGKNSKYKNWYEVKSFGKLDSTKNHHLFRRGFDYKGWWGTKSLPIFNRTKNDLAPGPKQYIFNATKRWMDPNKDGNTSDGIDGWRLDVANEVPLGFWKDWQKLVKSINPNSIIIGEFWKLSPKYISKNGPFDGLMNYNFAFAVDSFFIAKKSRITTSRFIEKLHRIDTTYPEQNLYVLQNLMDSHDTERLASMIANPDRKYDQGANGHNPNYNPGKPDSADYHMQKLIAAFQMTYRGAPMIYYGDEVGMWGADDPYDRMPMVWANLKYDNEVITKASGFKKGFGSYKVAPNEDLLKFYKKVISIRDNNPVLRYGGQKFLYSNDAKRTFAFERFKGNTKIIVAFNLGEKSDDFNIPVGGDKLVYQELINGGNGSLTGSSEVGAKLNIVINPISVKIFKVKLLK